MLAPVRDGDTARFLTPIPAFQLLREPPRREWMVERALPRGTVAMLSGDGGIGKSLLLQQLLTAAAFGLPWLGLSTVTGKGAFFGCEDDEDELHRRQWNICRAIGRDMTDLVEADALHLFARVDRDNALARVDRKAWRMEPTELFTKFCHYCRTRGIVYVVIDTASQTFAGPQNDEQLVVQFVNMLRRLAILIQGVVVITKHPSMSGRANGTGESGSTQWHNSVRSRLYLHKDKARGLVLETKKSNYGPADWHIPLKWERVFTVREQQQARNWYEAEQ